MMKMKRFEFSIRWNQAGLIVFLRLEAVTIISRSVKNAGNQI